MKKKHMPKRICVGCEDLKSKNELLRVVLTPSGDMELDATGKKLGRGAYMCASDECFDKAYNARRLERSLKRKVKPGVYEMLKEELHDAK